jgi:hypothetical protein
MGVASGNTILRMRIREIAKLLDDVENRRKGLRIWLLLVLIWSITRTFIVEAVFHKYGLNTFRYFLIDFLSSIPYAYASAHSLLALYDKRFKAAYGWIALTVASFYLPDVYIIQTSHRVPPSIYTGFAISLAVLSLLALTQWRAHRNK